MYEQAWLCFQQIACRLCYSVFDPFFFIWICHSFDRGDQTKQARGWFIQTYSYLVTAYCNLIILPLPTQAATFMIL